jgi:hypothetical protein
MKNLANMMTPGAGQDFGGGAGGLLSIGVTFAPGRAFRIPFTTTRSLAVRPVANGATIGRKRTFHDRAPRYDVVALHDIHIVPLLIVADGAIGNDQHLVWLAERNAHAHKQSRKQCLILVFKNSA